MTLDIVLKLMSYIRWYHKKNWAVTVNVLVTAAVIEYYIHYDAFNAIFNFALEKAHHLHFI